MANNLIDEIETELFCRALVYEIIDEYLRGKIEPSQALEVHIRQYGAVLKLKDPSDSDTLEDIYIDFQLPEIEIYSGEHAARTLHLADPRLTQKAVLILREYIKDLNRRAKVYHYQLSHGTYYLLKDTNGYRTPDLLDKNNIILATDTVAICFAIDKDENGTSYILHKHGRPDNVNLWATKTRNSYRKAGMEDLAQSITVIEGKFPVEEINKCLDISGYLKTLCEKYSLKM